MNTEEDTFKALKRSSRQDAIERIIGVLVPEGMTIEGAYNSCLEGTGWTLRELFPDVELD